MIPTPSDTPTRIVTPTPSDTPSVTPTRTVTPTPTGTPTGTPTQTDTPTLINTPTGTPTRTPTPTDTPTDTPTPTGPSCDGQAATIYVNAQGRIVGGPNNGKFYQGKLTGTKRLAAESGPTSSTAAPEPTRQRTSTRIKEIPSAAWSSSRT